MFFLKWLLKWTRCLRLTQFYSLFPKEQCCLRVLTSGWTQCWGSMDPPRTTLSIQAWPPEAQIHIHISYSAHVFPPLLLPGFNAPLVSAQPPLKYILLFVVSKQQGEKQNWKVWQSQLPTDTLPCLCQKTGAVSDKKAESGECTESFKRQQWRESLQQARVDVCQAGIALSYISLRKYSETIKGSHVAASAHLI